jgi:GT2 family glycosyltransferase
MQLSVIIISWNAQRDVKQCLDSVIDATSNYNSEIIVTDNGSSDETLSILQSYGEQIKLICLNKNKGVAYARNVGMKAAKGDYIWILDVDTVVNMDAVSGMLNYLINNSLCGVCSCRLQSERGEIQESCRRLPYPKHKIRNLIISKKGSVILPKKLFEIIEKKNEAQFYRKELQATEPFECEYVIGACQMFRKSILEEVGYLDQNIFYGPEDADFCSRVSAKGYSIICLPEYSIIHHYNRVTNRKLLTKLTFYHLKGLIYFYWKRIRKA